MPFILLLVGTAVAAGYGALILRLLAVRPADRLQGIVESIGLGLGFLGHLTLFLAACGFLYPQAYILAAVPGLAALGQLKRATAGTARREHMPGWGWVLITIGVVLLAGETLKLMAPPVGGDQTKYQLVYPRLFAEARGLVDTPWSFWGNMQYLLNWLFTAAFVLDGDVLARLCHALFGLLTALALYGFGRSCFGAAAGLIAAGVFFCAPITTTLMTQAWVDLGAVFYTLMALWAFVRWWNGDKGGDLILAGLMAGLAGATKPLGLATTGVLGLGILWRLLTALRLEAVPAGTRKAHLGGAPEGATAQNPSRWLASGFAFTIVALLAASPCYLRNATSTGNPVYPFAYSVFGGRAWSREAAAYLGEYYRTYREEHAQKRPGPGEEQPLAKAFRVGWNLTMYPNSYEKTSRSGYDLSPFLLACLPVVLVARRRRIAAGLLVFGAAYLLVVSQVWIHPRYLLPGLIPWLLACSAGLVAFSRGRLGRMVPAVVTILTVGFSTVLSLEMLSWHWRDDLAVARGQMTEDAYLRRYDKRYDLWSLINSRVPESGKVLLLDKIPHPYHIRRSFVSGSYLEQGLIDYHAIGSPDELLRAVLRLGVTHVAQPGPAPARDPFEAHVFGLWRGFLARFCRPVASAGDAKLYAVSAPGEVTMAEGARQGIS